VVSGRSRSLRDDNQNGNGKSNCKSKDERKGRNGRTQRAQRKNAMGAMEERKGRNV